VNDTENVTGATAARWIALALDGAAAVGIEVRSIGIGRLTLGRRPVVDLYGTNVDEAAARALAAAMGGTDVAMGKPYGSGPQANLTFQCDEFDVSALVNVLPPTSKLATVTDAELVAEIERRRHEATAGPDHDADLDAR
jgi:hypothetical protein